MSNVTQSARLVTLFILCLTIFTLNCGGGGGGGGGGSAPSSDNFGSIMSTGPIVEREYDEEFWTPNGY